MDPDPYLPTAWRRRLSIRSASLIIVGALAGLAVAYGALRTARGQWWDNRAMTSVSAPSDVIIGMLRGLNTVSVATTAVAMGICMLAALLRGRWQLAVAAGVLVSGANVSTQVLKYHIFTRADVGVPSALSVANSLPSGHTTVVASLALAAVIVSPRRLRLLAVLGSSLMCTLVGVSVVLARWHRPSDVLAALGVCLSWAGVGLLLASLLTRRPPARTRRSMAVVYPAVALVGPALVALGIDRLGLYAIGSFKSSVLAALGLLSIGLAATFTSAVVGTTSRRLDQPEASHNLPATQDLEATATAGVAGAPARVTRSIQ